MFNSFADLCVTCNSYLKGFDNPKEPTIKGRLMFKYYPVDPDFVLYPYLDIKFVRDRISANKLTDLEMSLLYVAVKEVLGEKSVEDVELHYHILETLKSLAYKWQVLGNIGEAKLNDAINASIKTKDLHCLSFEGELPMTDELVDSFKRGVYIRSTIHKWEYHISQMLDIHRRKELNSEKIIDPRIGVG